MIDEPSAGQHYGGAVAAPVFNRVTTGALHHHFPTKEDLFLAVLDQLLGRPGVDDGGITSSSSRRLPGDVSAGATAAIDGDPSTHWSPGFLANR